MQRETVVAPTQKNSCTNHVGSSNSTKLKEYKFRATYNLFKICLLVPKMNHVDRWTDTIYPGHLYTVHIVERIYNNGKYTYRWDEKSRLRLK
jgi:hypothetical protein